PHFSVSAFPFSVFRTRCLRGSRLPHRRLTKAGRAVVPQLRNEGGSAFQTPSTSKFFSPLSTLATFYVVSDFSLSAFQLLPFASPHTKRRLRSRLIPFFSR